MSHPAWGAWIETLLSIYRKVTHMSHPAWGAWIETIVSRQFLTSPKVAPRLGCVD